MKKEGIPNQLILLSFHFFLDRGNIGCPTFHIKRKPLDHVDKRRYQEIVVMYQNLNCLLESITLKSPGQISFSTSSRQHQV